MVKVKFKYQFGTFCLGIGLEIDVEAEVDTAPDGHPYVFWDSWKFDGKEVLDTDLVPDKDKELIYQRIMDEYDDIILERGETT